MAVYKVIQDVEADDKLLGPLTLRQFVYAGITVFCLYLSYMALTKGAAFLLVVFLPPAFIAGFFAFPWGREQPTEIWALARIRFMFKPRKRTWNQTGIKELVTITVPKKIEKVYTDGLSQTEVKSRLQALATTIDSRGWAIKSASMSPYTTTPVVAIGNNNDEERLINVNAMPQSVPTDDTTIYDDVLDPTNNPKAQQFDAILEQNAQAQRERLMSQMQQASTNESQDAATQTTRQPADYWFLNQPQATTGSNQTTFGSQVVTPGAPAANTDVDKIEEQQLVQQLRENAQEQTMQYSHLPTVLPLAEQEKLAKQQAQNHPPTPTPPQQISSPTSVTDKPDTAILELAQKDDWNISTIARQARKAHGEEPDEVVISLH